MGQILILDWYIVTGYCDENGQLEISKSARTYHKGLCQGPTDPPPVVCLMTSKELVRIIGSPQNIGNIVITSLPDFLYTRIGCRSAIKIYHRYDKIRLNMNSLIYRGKEARTRESLVPLKVQTPFK
jgi:hypothetical protein